MRVRDQETTVSERVSRLLLLMTLWQAAFVGILGGRVVNEAFQMYLNIPEPAFTETVNRRVDRQKTAQIHEIIEGDGKG